VCISSLTDAPSTQKSASLSLTKTSISRYLVSRTAGAAAPWSPSKAEYPTYLIQRRHLYPTSESSSCCGSDRLRRVAASTEGVVLFVGDRFAGCSRSWIAEQDIKAGYGAYLDRVVTGLDKDRGGRDERT
jgi:hypothetical protein